MTTILKPPTPLQWDTSIPSVFLAGSIDKGSAADWQADVEQQLEGEQLVILNPRRDAWDNSWEQSIHHVQFREQVEWELEGMEKATLVTIYFSPPTQAPISLLELGLHARSERIVVCCPEGYWRKGNVDIVCARYNVPLVETLTDMVSTIKRRLLSQ